MSYALFTQQVFIFVGLLDYRVGGSLLKKIMLMDVMMNVLYCFSGR